MTTYRFLKDDPLTEPKEIQFGHVSIARALSKAIENSDTPFTLALIGSWGSGKSTILGAASKELKGIPVVVFDVWKYETDDLRRSFLTALVKDLKRYKKLPPNFELDPRVTQRISGVLNSKFKFNFASIGPLLLRSLTMLIIGLVLAALLVLLADVVIARFFPDWLEQFHKNIPIVLTGAPLFSAIMALLLKSLDSSVTVSTTNFNEERFTFPEEFELEFQNILQKVSKEGGSRIAIAFDNLDRVSANRAIEIIAMVKTFLEPPPMKNQAGVVFIICCDEEALVKHLAQTQDSHANQNNIVWAREFLMKFFNARVRIPEIIPAELEHYTLGLYTQAGFVGSSVSYLARLTATVHRSSPRLMKQFINDICAYLNLLNLMASEGDLEAERLGNDHIGLALYLHISERASNLLSWANLHGINLYDLSRKIRVQSYKCSIDGFEGEIERSVAIAIQTYGRLSKTPIKAFARMRLPDYEANLPGCTEAMTAIRDGDIVKVSEFLQSLESVTDNLAATQALKQLGDDLPSNEIRLGSANTFLLATRNLEKPLSPDIREELLRWVHSSLESPLHRLRTDLLFANIIAPMPRPELAAGLTKDVITTVLRDAKSSASADPPWGDDDELEMSIVRHLKGILTDDDWVDSEVAEAISEILLTEEIKGRPKPLLEAVSNTRILDLLTIDMVDQVTLFATSDGFWTDYSAGSKSAVSKLEVVKDAFSVIAEFQSAKGWNTFKAHFDGLLEHWGIRLTQLTEGKLDSNSKVRVLALSKIVEVVQRAENDETYVQSDIERAVQALVSGALRNMYSLLSDEERVPIIAVTAWLIWGSSIRGFDDPGGGGDGITSYLQRASAEQIKMLADWNSLGLEPYTDNDEYSTTLKARSFSNLAMLDIVLPRLGDSLRSEWIIELIGKNPALAIEYGQHIRWNDEVIRKGVIDALVNRLENDWNSPSVLSTILSGLESLREYLDDSHISRVVASIRMSIMDSNTEVQNAVLEFAESTSLLSESSKRELLQGLVDDLERTDPNEGKYSAPCTVVIDYIDALSGQKLYRKRFIEYLFGRLCIDGYNSRDYARAQKGLEFLKTLMPSHRNYSTYYDDVLKGIRAIENEGVRIQHCALLGSLRGKSNAKYWQEVARVCESSSSK